MAKKVKETARVIEAVDKKYELMLVLQPELLESARDKKLREFDKFLEENGGKVELKEIMGKQKLAYRIGKYGDGIYVIYNVILPNSFNKELNEHLRIDKDVIRFLHLSLKDNYSYEKFEEQDPEPKKDISQNKGGKADSDEGRSGRTGKVTHKASSTEPVKTEIKDKGKKASAESLDAKLDKLLEGDDLNI